MTIELSTSVAFVPHFGPEQLSQADLASAPTDQWRALCVAPDRTCSVGSLHGSTISFTLQGAAVWPFDLEGDEPAYSVDFTSWVTVPLRTGRLAGSRVEHARRLRLARWKRRRQRRHGIPAASRFRRVYIPRAWLGPQA